ncbi:helix-turn-helix transcriptional regulator [Duganella zoogloeoides]|uniref:helix-turn-helix transcriptional regulator n=1 Tax=Duganella zoogloeoides TaxID=75659 RepID=UPI00036BCF87
MSLPSFDQGDVTKETLRKRLGDRVRLERRRKKLTQKDFADACGVALRTYKRFEAGECDSLDAFLAIVIHFERLVALELLFPPKDLVELKPRTPGAALEQFRRRVER